MKTWFLAVLLILAGSLSISAVDIGLGFDLGSGTFRYNHLDQDTRKVQHNTGLGMFLEIGVVRHYAILFDANVGIDYFNQSGGDRNNQHRFEVQLGGFDLSLLNKIRVGNRFRWFLTLGPSVAVQYIEKTRDFYERDPFFGLVMGTGFEWDMGPGYLFIGLKYGGYLNLRTAKDEKMDQTVGQFFFNTYADKIQGYIGYAVRFGKRDKGL